MRGPSPTARGEGHRTALIGLDEGRAEHHEDDAGDEQHRVAAGERDQRRPRSRGSAPAAAWWPGRGSRGRGRRCSRPAGGRAAPRSSGRGRWRCRRRSRGRAGSCRPGCRSWSGTTSGMARAIDMTTEDQTMNGLRRPIRSESQPLARADSRTPTQQHDADLGGEGVGLVVAEADVVAQDVEAVGLGAVEADDHGEAEANAQAKSGCWRGLTQKPRRNCLGRWCARGAGRGWTCRG